MHNAPSTRGGSLPLKAAIADELRERIASGALPLGSRISDKAIADELRVSRTPVREALLQLANDRLVQMHPQRGTYVFSPGADEMRELCELRGILEAGAARLLAARQDRPASAALSAIVRSARASLARRDWDACDARDTQFHEALVGSCGNRLLLEGYRAISGRIRALRRHLPRTNARVAPGLAEHAAIARAIGRGDGDRAAAIVEAHVGNVRRLLQTLSGSKGAQP